ncbi:LuxR family transcriptional regulator [Eggerthella sp. NSJ-70]|uniref:LuxR family transcriptional regulator n=2 Tax=Eggerthella hominis TaxID=2763043 RepID=A0ABR7BSV4_9ACTN|nr:LuxR family transcriptional regulator [Eggerthella hominis]MBC5584688.1 LuxR family transcriptional regulator [Eggerthella hominis]
MERAGLSVREREVLEHLRQGRAPKTIAKVLFVSENTVRFHIRNIYQKFGVHSRTDLMELFDDELDARETVERSGGS